MRICSRPGIWILACLLLVSGVGLSQAQSFPRTLENIKFILADGREIIQFEFSHPFEGEPLQEHSPGSFLLNFSGTGSKNPVRSFRINESKFVNSIKIIQNKFSTTATFSLIDPKTSFKGRLEFSRDGNILRVTLGARPVSSPPAAIGKTPAGQLLVEMSDKIAGPGSGLLYEESAPAISKAAQKDISPENLGGFNGIDWLPAMITLGVSLAAIVVVLYLIVYLYNRFSPTRLRRFGGTQSIKQIASFHIGTKQRIVILNINGEVIACGVTPTQISFLTRLGGDTGGGQKRAPAGRSPKKGGSATAGSSDKSQPAAGAAEAVQTAKSAKSASAGKADPVQQFADALKEKVSAMKRLK